MNGRIATIATAVLLATVAVLCAGSAAQATASPTPTPSRTVPAETARPGTTPSPSMSPCPGETTSYVPGGPLPLVLCVKAKPGQPPVSGYDPSKIANDRTTPDPDPCAGVLDMGCQARHAVTGWFQSLVKSAIGPTFDVLGATVLATPDINAPAMASTRAAWATSRQIANGCFVLLITIGGILLMTGTVLPHQLGLRDVLPRLVLAFLAANLSLILIGYGITFANGLANAFLTAGRARIDPHAAADVMGHSIESTVNTGNLFLVVVALVAVVLAAGVALIYIARLAITMVLIAAAPLALMFGALPFTEGLPRLWWRAITGMLAIQVCQSLVLVTALQILLSSDPKAHNNRFFYQAPTTTKDALDLLLLICLLYVLLRIPSWVARTIWQQARPRLLGQVVKSLLIYRGIGALLHKANPRRTTTPTHRPPNGPGGPRRPGGGRRGPNPTGGGGRNPAGGGSRPHSGPTGGGGSTGSGPGGGGPNSGNAGGGSPTGTNRPTGGNAPNGRPADAATGSRARRGTRNGPNASDSNPASTAGIGGAGSALRHRHSDRQQPRSARTGPRHSPAANPAEPLASVTPLKPRSKPGPRPVGTAVVLRLEPQPGRRFGWNARKGGKA